MHFIHLNILAETISPYCFEHGVEYESGGLRSISKIPTALECMKSCAIDVDCFYFTWRKNDQYCFLKEKEGWTRDFGYHYYTYISGPDRCFKHGKY